MDLHLGLWRCLNSRLLKPLLLRLAMLYVPFNIKIKIFFVLSYRWPSGYRTAMRVSSESIDAGLQKIRIDDLWAAVVHSYIHSRSKYKKNWKIMSFHWINSLVLAVLLYGCKTRETTERNKKKSNTFQNRCVRKILKVRWPDKNSVEELYTWEQKQPE